MIVHVIGRFPPPFDGQTLATRRMAELIGARHDVRRINTEPPASEFVENEVAFRWSRVRHYVELQGMIRAELSKAAGSPVLWASISPSALGHFRDVLTTAPAFRPDQPVAGVIHRSGYDALFRSPLTKLSASRLARQLSAFVFLNEQLSRECAGWIPDHKRYVIPNTIDETLVFSSDELELKRQERRGRESVHLLFLSNMIPLKGYSDVLAAIPILKERQLSIEADFVGRWGSEADRRSFDDYTARHDLRGIVRYHGGVNDRARVKDFYRRADVFALPSYHPTEAQPVALIEAMNAGLPIITTQHGGIPAMFSDGVPLFVSPQSPEEIASAVEAVVDPRAWMVASAKSRDNYDRRFSPEVVQKQWESLLGELRS